MALSNPDSHDRPERRSPTWGTAAEIETRKRILVAVAAYAYEILNEPLLSDADFDALCLEVDLTQPTGSVTMDDWFRDNFSPYTGQWVHDHPNKARLRDIAAMILGVEP